MTKYTAIITFLCVSLMNTQLSVAATDRGEFHYKSAEKYSSQERFSDALNEYNQAIATDDKNFNYWLGRGQAELALSNHAAVSKTIEKLDDYEDTKEQKFERFLLDAQYHFATKPKGWLSKTKDLFFKSRSIANQLKLQSSDLFLLMGRVYRDVGKNKKARKYYSEVVMLGGANASIANNELASIFRQAQASGTGKGWIGDLASKKTIDRATLAYLLVDDMRIEKLFKVRETNPSSPTDIKNNEFHSAIEIVLGLQMTSLGLDAKEKFNPTASVTRYELAKLIEEILVAHAKSPELLRTFVGTKSPFPDVSANYHAYNAVFLAVSRGLIAPDDMITGAFAGSKTVSGEDILLVLRKLGSLKP